MKNLTSVIIASIIFSNFSMSATSFAASHVAAPASAGSVASLPMADAEIRKIDLENKKITLKHGEIKNLDMPGMTMVFQVRDAAMLDNIKAGDRVKFTADKVNGVFTVLTIEIAK